MQTKERNSNETMKEKIQWDTAICGNKNNTLSKYKCGFFTFFVFFPFILGRFSVFFFFIFFSTSSYLWTRSSSKYDEKKQPIWSLHSSEHVLTYQRGKTIPAKWYFWVLSWVIFLALLLFIHSLTSKFTAHIGWTIINNLLIADNRVEREKER